MVDLKVWQFILILFIELIVVAIATFILTRKLFARQLKKNPPINEKMVRAMLTQMGRTPSEKQVRAVMKSMEDAK
ncbi:MAG: YneF family protein [Anaeroplasmataceae bacterium]|nr:YneF family protein [Anaeroplasmataceae bacterium]